MRLPMRVVKLDVTGAGGVGQQSPCLLQTPDMLLFSLNVYVCSSQSALSQPGAYLPCMDISLVLSTDAHYTMSVCCIQRWHH